VAKPETPPPGFALYMLIERIFDTLNHLIKWAGIATIAVCVYLCVKELAGHQTVAQFVVGYFTDKSGGGSKAPWIGTTILSAGWAAFERWLRHRKVATMSGRLKKFESEVDSNRTGSGLDASGRPQSSKRAKK
jgi:hypothetical protein